MASYKIETTTTDGVTTVTVGFGSPAQNDQIVRDAAQRLDELVAAGQLPGGGLVKITGPASLPVAMVLAHRLVHLYEALGVFDPKLNKFVVAVSHGGPHQVGNLID